MHENFPLDVPFPLDIPNACLVTLTDFDTPATVVSQAMPAAHMPLRQYSSQQGMRQLDGLRQYAPHEANINTVNHDPSSQSNGAYQKKFTPIGVHDFQEFPTRRPNTANATKASSKVRYDAPSPMPSFHHPPPMQSPEPPRSVFP